MAVPQLSSCVRDRRQVMLNLLKDCLDRLSSCVKQIPEELISLHRVYSPCLLKGSVTADDVPSGVEHHHKGTYCIEDSCTKFELGAQPLSFACTR